MIEQTSQSTSAHVHHIAKTARKQDRSLTYCLKILDSWEKPSVQHSMVCTSISVIVFRSLGRGINHKNTWKPAQGREFLTKARCTTFSPDVTKADQGCFVGQCRPTGSRENPDQHIRTPSLLSPAHTAFVPSFERKVGNLHYEAHIQALGNQTSCQTLLQLPLKKILKVFSCWSSPKSRIQRNTILVKMYSLPVMGIQSHQIININRWTKGQGKQIVMIALILSMKKQ